MPFHLLQDRTLSRGIGGASPYFRERAFLGFRDVNLTRAYSITLLIAEPSPDNIDLPSLLGRDVTRHWYMRYDPANSRIECDVNPADYTL